MTKPKYKKAIERFAKLKGITPEEFEKRLLEARGTYPGPECLEPDEIEVYTKSQYPYILPPNRIKHLENCPSCRAMIESGSFVEGE